MDTPAAARAFARDAVERAQASVPSDHVALVVSELVTNAVVHGDGDITLSLAVEGDAVEVEVADQDPALPTPVDAPVDAAAGRGLLLVSRLAQDWGVRPHGSGKVVWAQLAS